MAIDIDGASPAAPPAELPTGGYRPAPPDRGIGRWMRVLCGIREDILDWVPEERPRYTGFGIIVLNTGCFAALAMFTAMNKIVSAPPLAFLPVALLWGWIILSIDRWLIASTHGVHQAWRLPLIFAPRLVLAFLLALSIAEPLTLWIFQPALNREIHQFQTSQLVAYQSLLKSCNPPTGVPVSAGRCEGARLSIQDPPGGVLNELTDARRQQATTQREVDAIEKTISHLRTKAQGECAGAHGPGLTGIPGVGWQCRRDWTAVRQYQSSSGLAAQLSLLHSLTNTISQLIPKVGTAQQTAAQEVGQAITTAVEAKKTAQQGRIGLLDQWGALDRLSAQSSFVTVGHWLLWLILIAIDCLPITAKMMSRSTAYDRLLSGQLESSERVHEVDLQLREQNATADKDVAIQFGEITKQERLRRLAHDERMNRAQREADVVASAEELATRWVREAEQRDADREGGTDEDGPAADLA
jgi:hypothetical protein